MMLMLLSLSLSLSDNVLLGWEQTDRGKSLGGPWRSCDFHKLLHGKQRSEGKGLGCEG